MVQTRSTCYRYNNVYAEYDCIDYKPSDYSYGHYFYNYYFSTAAETTKSYRF
jgi:hypothetical protein